MIAWKSIAPLPGPPRSGPVVHVSRPAVTVQEIHFAWPRPGDHCEYMYRNSSAHPVARGDLQGWARGPKITSPEWVAGRSNNYPACFVRTHRIAMRVKLVRQAGPAASGTLTATPRIGDDATIVTPATVRFDLAAGARETFVEITLGGRLPDAVGQYPLRITWTVTVPGSSPVRVVSEHTIFSVYRHAFRPEYDSTRPDDPGVFTTVDEGTLTGTPRRLNRLMSLLGGRHPTATPEDVADLIWKLHVGINDTPGAPPYFDGAHDEHLTRDGGPEGPTIDLADQWLAWVRTPNPHWNDASCIGHVQLLKTMAASIGLFARRVWVVTATSQVGNQAVTLPDTDLYCLGDRRFARQQSAVFVGPDDRRHRAYPVLMLPNKHADVFEACVLTHDDRFLPGGYETSRLPRSFRANKGFHDVREVLRWWTTSRTADGWQRFMCWMHINEAERVTYLWDVDGRYYPLRDFEEIRRRGKQLPPP
jgi:hypothetical protein